MPAIGTPAAKLFFEPQNTIVISSALSKPQPRAAATEAKSTNTSTVPHITASNIPDIWPGSAAQSLLGGVCRDEGRNGRPCPLLG